MKKLNLFFAATAVAISACNSTKQHDMIAPAEKINVLAYPDTKKENVKDDYFGTIVEDPYRWLEDDLSAETKAWVQAQNKVTENYLS